MGIDYPAFLARDLARGLQLKGRGRVLPLGLLHFFPKDRILDPSLQGNLYDPGFDDNISLRLTVFP